MIVYDIVLVTMLSVWRCPVYRNRVSSGTEGTAESPENVSPSAGQPLPGLLLLTPHKQEDRGEGRHRGKVRLIIAGASQDKILTLGRRALQTLQEKPKTARISFSWYPLRQPGSPGERRGEETQTES